VDLLWTRLSGDFTRHFPDYSSPVSLAVGMEKSVLRTLFTPLRLIRHESMRVICGVDFVPITVWRGHERIQSSATCKAEKGLLTLIGALE
jgi:hypothetical protein